MTAPLETGPALSPVLAAAVSRFLVRCHPRSWRERYAAEVLELLDQYQPTGHTVLDLWVSAVGAQLDPAWWGRPSASAVRAWINRPFGAFVMVSAVMFLLLGGILGYGVYRDYEGNIGPRRRCLRPRRHGDSRPAHGRRHPVSVAATVTA